MKRWALLTAVLAVALAVAALALRTPSPEPADGPATAFSAGRAMADIVMIAQRPHPMGSPEASGVQEALFARLQALGLSPAFRPFKTAQGPGRNILGVLPGADRAPPAVLLMAHSDSVPRGVGAADDGAGVAAILEVVRALKASGPLKHDVMVLITDGEEPGLYGAAAFFSSDPARTHVGVVLNLEARGDRGRAVMFETHMGAESLIRTLIDADALRGASSLMPDLYRRLPNGTDLSEAIKRGYAGLNFAVFDGFDAYHEASDTPQRLDEGSLQSLGDQVLAAARALATATKLPSRAADRVYADVLGRTVLQYPSSAAWGLMALAVAAISLVGVRALREGQTSLTGVAAGVLAVAGLLFFLILALSGLGLLRAALAQRHLAPLLRHSGWALAGAGLLSGGVTLNWLRLAGGRLKSASLILGALKLFALTAIILQAFAPLDAFVAAWPLLLTAVGAVLAGAAKRDYASPLFAAAAAAQLFYWCGLIFALVGQTTPAVLAPFMVLTMMALLPLAPSAGRWSGWTGLACMGGGLALSLAALAG